MAEDTSDWPGERQPTQLDIERAQDIAEPNLQQEFKRSLLANGTIQAYQQSASVTSDEIVIQSADFADLADEGDEGDEADVGLRLENQAATSNNLGASQRVSLPINLLIRPSPNSFPRDYKLLQTDISFALSPSRLPSRYHQPQRAPSYTASIFRFIARLLGGVHGEKPIFTCRVSWRSEHRADAVRDCDHSLACHTGKRQSRN